jgi:hypothetical protein
LQLSLLLLLLLLLLLQTASAITALYAAPAALHSNHHLACFLQLSLLPLLLTLLQVACTTLAQRPPFFWLYHLKSGCRTSKAADSDQHLLYVLRLWLPLLLLLLLCMASAITALSAAPAGLHLLCVLQLSQLPLLLPLLQVACTTPVQSLPSS